MSVSEAYQHDLQSAEPAGEAEHPLAYGDEVRKVSPSDKSANREAVEKTSKRVSKRSIKQANSTDDDSLPQLKKEEPAAATSAQTAPLPPLSSHRRKSVGQPAAAENQRFLAAKYMSEVLAQKREEQIRRQEAEMAVLEQIDRENRIQAEKEKAERLMRQRDEARQKLQQRRLEREKVEALREERPPETVANGLREWKNRERRAVEEQKVRELEAQKALEEKRARYREAELQLRRMRIEQREREMQELAALQPQAPQAQKTQAKDASQSLHSSKNAGIQQPQQQPTAQGQKKTPKPSQSAEKAPAAKKPSVADPKAAGPTPEAKKPVPAAGKPSKTQKAPGAAKPSRK